MQEVDGAGCECALHHMSDVRDVNAARSSIRAYHHGRLPATTSASQVLHARQRSVKGSRSLQRKVSSRNTSNSLLASGKLTASAQLYQLPVNRARLSCIMRVQEKVITCCAWPAGRRFCPPAAPLCGTPEAPGLPPSAALQCCPLRPHWLRRPECAHCIPPPPRLPLLLPDDG
jgi:hypothetical protein